MHGLGLLQPSAWVSWRIPQDQLPQGELSMTGGAWASPPPRVATAGLLAARPGGQSQGP